MDAGPAVFIFIFLLMIFTSLKTPPPPVLEEEKEIIKAECVISPEEKQGLEISIKNYVIKETKSFLPEEKALLICDYIFKFSYELEIDPVLVTALIKRESSFFSDKVSSSGAIGLGQVKPTTAQEVGIKDLFDIEQNIKATVIYLKKMLKNWSGHPRQVRLALASYKEGFGTIKRSNECYSAQTEKYIDDIVLFYNEIKSSLN